MVGVWVQVEGPFRAGPSDSGSVRTHVPIQGPQQVVVSPGRRSRHDGRCRLQRGCHRRTWSHTCAHANLVSILVGSRPGPGRSPSQGRSRCMNWPLSLPRLLAVSGCPSGSSVCSLARHYDRQVKGRAPSGRRSPGGGWPTGLRGDEVGAIERKKLMSPKLSDTPVTAEALHVQAISLSELRRGVEEFGTGTQRVVRPRTPRGQRRRPSSRG